MPNQLLPLLYKMLGHAGAGLLSLGGIMAAVDFRDQITLGSALVAALIVIVAGVFTIRSKIAATWRQDAEGWQARAELKQRELDEEKASRAEFDREQQELRHALKNDLAAAKAQLQVMEAKTDLTLALDTIRQMNESTVKELAAAITAAVGDGLQTAATGSEERDGRTHKLLEEIRDRMPDERTAA